MQIDLDDLRVCENCGLIYSYKYCRKGNNVIICNFCKNEIIDWEGLE